MQALFYMDMRDKASAEMLERFCGNFNPSKKTRPFFLKLVNGVLEVKGELDINRMSCVDRNVMRIAVFEFLYCDDIPPKVSINEAVDIGKKFGTEESGAFINGIMDGIRAELEKEGKLKKGDTVGG